MLIWVVYALYDEVVLIEMSTTDTVILLHQHLDWRLNVHNQNNKPLVYQRSIIVPRWQSMEGFWV